MSIALGYLGISTPAVDSWPGLAADILGCMPVEGGRDGALRFRVDDAAWRLQIHPAERNDVAYIGWTVRTRAELDGYRSRLVTAGIEVHDGDAATAADRQVQRMFWFQDPAGFRHEIAVGQAVLPRSFRPGRQISGFVTGDQGLGHVVLGVPDIEQAHSFFTELLGFGLSDTVVMPGGMGEGRFYHCNGRHHTLALAQIPAGRSLHHLMLEVGDIDDVGIALDMCRDRGVPIVKELGRHTNDEMTSFYLETPSAFLIEYGCGGIEIDPGWPEKTFYAPSIWGHQFPPGIDRAPGMVITD